jgi:hypothetical protein
MSENQPEIQATPPFIEVGSTLAIDSARFPVTSDDISKYLRNYSELILEWLAISWYQSFKGGVGF